MKRLALGLAAIGALAGCTPQPASVVPLGAGPEWQAVGISPADGQAYAKLGMSPLSAKDLQNAGMTPGELAQWEALKPTSLGSAYGNDMPIDTFLAAKKAGFYPSDIAPLVSAGLPLTNPAVVLNAVNLSRAGYSPSQSVDYAENGVTPDQVATYRRQRAREQAAARAAQAQAVAAQQAAAARKAQIDAEIAAKCPGGVQSGGMMFQMSPFAIEGKCYALSPLPVGQWESATEGLILGMGMPVDIETDTPMTGQMTPAGLYVGEAPLQYQAVSGAASTAYKLHYIGPDPR